MKSSVWLALRLLFSFLAAVMVVQNLDEGADPPRTAEDCRMYVT